MLRAEMSSTMELVPLLCLFVLSCSGSSSAAGAGPERIIVMEGSNVTLPCSTSEDISSKRFEWKKDGQKKKEVYVYDAGLLSGQDEQFKDRVSYFPGELEKGNASITVTNTKITDTGNYTCEFPRLNQKVFIILLVGAAPEPSVTNLNETDNWALLRCVVRGASPKPKVEWQDSDGNILQAERPQVTERGGRYDVILQTTVTKTDHYRCVATQEEIKHQIHAEIYVFMGGPETPTGHSTGVVVGAVAGGLVLGVCVLLAVQNCRRKMKSQSNSG